MYLGKTRLGPVGPGYYRNGLGIAHKGLRPFWVMSLVLLLLVVVSIFLLTCYVAALFTPLFKLEDVGFQGLKRVSSKELLRQGGLDKGVNLLALNLREVKRNLEVLPWVKEVRLQRELPNRLQVVIVEHQPVLLALVGEGLYYVNEEGLLFKKVEPADEHAWPILTGLTERQLTVDRRVPARIWGEVNALRELLSQGKDPFYPHKLSEIHYDPDCGFSLFTLERGIRINLGKEELAQRLNRLEKVWAELEKRPEALAVKGISLQYGRKVIVHGLRPEGPKKGRG